MNQCFVPWGLIPEIAKVGIAVVVQVVEPCQHAFQRFFLCTVQCPAALLVSIMPSRSISDISTDVFVATLHCTIGAPKQFIVALASTIMSKQLQMH
jgi:hypothetical protein